MKIVYSLLLIFILHGHRRFPMTMARNKMKLLFRIVYILDVCIPFVKNLLNVLILKL